MDRSIIWSHFETTFVRRVIRPKWCLVLLLCLSIRRVWGLPTTWRLEGRILEPLFTERGLCGKGLVFEKRSAVSWGIGASYDRKKVLCRPKIVLWRGVLSKSRPIIRIKDEIFQVVGRVVKPFERCSITIANTPGNGSPWTTIQDFNDPSFPKPQISLLQMVYCL